MNINTQIPLITIENIQVILQQHVILQDISLNLESNQIITLIGPNGAGKTTLVKVILGLIKPQKGTVQRRPEIRIGYMPQRLQIDATLPITVERFLQLGGTVDKQKIQRALSEVGASHTLKRPLQQISGGETQRILLARALLRSPDLLVLDEPIQGVDVAGQYELYELIASIRQQRNCGILMVSHDLHLVMAATDWVICLNQHICCFGHPETVTQHPAYLALFGRRAAHDLAIYTHHHQCAKHGFTDTN